MAALVASTAFRFVAEVPGEYRRSNSIHQAKCRAQKKSEKNGSESGVDAAGGVLRQMKMHQKLNGEELQGKRVIKPCGRLRRV
jgi:hypothetical protein